MVPNRNLHAYRVGGKEIVATRLQRKGWVGGGAGHGDRGQRARGWGGAPIEDRWRRPARAGAQHPAMGRRRLSPWALRTPYPPCAHVANDSGGAGGDQAKGDSVPPHVAFASTWVDHDTPTARHAKGLTSAGHKLPEIMASFPTRRRRAAGS